MPLGGIDPPLRPYESRVLPLHHRGFNDLNEFLLILFYKDEILLIYNMKKIFTLFSIFFLTITFFNNTFAISDDSSETKLKVIGFGELGDNKYNGLRLF